MVNVCGWRWGVAARAWALLRETYRTKGPNMIPHWDILEVAPPAMTLKTHAWWATFQHQPSCVNEIKGLLEKNVMRYYMSVNIKGEKLVIICLVSWNAPMLHVVWIFEGSRLCILTIDRP